MVTDKDQKINQSTSIVKKKTKQNKTKQNKTKKDRSFENK